MRKIRTHLLNRLRFINYMKNSFCRTSKVAKYRENTYLVYGARWLFSTFLFRISGSSTSYTDDCKKKEEYSNALNGSFEI